MRVLLAILILSATSTLTQNGSPTVSPVNPVPQEGSPTPQTQKSQSHKQSKASVRVSVTHPNDHPDSQPKEDAHKPEPSNGIYKVDVVSQPVPPRDPLFVAYVIFTGLAVLVGLVTLGLIHRQTNALMNADRAWLSIETIELLNLVPIEHQPSGNQNATSAICHIKNYGRGPATVVEIRAKLETRSKRDASDAQLDDSIYESSGSEVEHGMEPRVVPQGIGFSFERRPENWFMTAEEIGAINCKGPNRAFFFIHGIIRYQDAFRRDHITRFCYRYDIEYFVGPGRAGFYFADRPAGYNQQT